MPDHPPSRRACEVLLGVLVALLYNAWSLGFVLDRDALRGTYISALEVRSHPHAYVFVVADLAASALAVGLGLLLRARHQAAGLGLVVFGLGNALEAAIAIDGDCARSVAACGIGVRAVLAPHDLASIVSIAGLAYALWAVRERAPWGRAVLAVWVVSGLFMVASVTFVFWVTLSQAVFLAACGVALVSVPASPPVGEALRGR